MLLYNITFLSRRVRVAMPLLRLLPCFLVFLVAAPAQAERPRLVVSLAPLHALAAAVAGERADLHLLIRGTASPHDHQLRPSDARALQAADLVLWVGPSLERFLERPLATLAGRARRLTLLEEPDILRLPARAPGVAGGDGHHHDSDHAPPRDTDHAPPRDDDHAPPRDDHHAHPRDGSGTAGGAVDPHLWLSPDNARVVVALLAVILSQLDPAGQAHYAERAEAVLARIDALDEALARRLAPVRDRPFVVFHDAFGYLQNHYGLTVAASVTVDPARPPGARRLREIREAAKRAGARCIFGEPQFRAAVVRTVADAAGLRVGQLDPVGSDSGPEGWFTLMRTNGEALARCLSGNGAD